LGYFESYKVMLIYGKEAFLIRIFGLIFTLNILKPWLDYYASISHQVVTGFQFILLLFVVTLFNNKFYRKSTFLAFLVIVILAVKLTLETSINVLKMDYMSIASSLYFIIRVLLVIYMIQVLILSKRSLNFFLSLRSMLIGYFLVTVIYSSLQYPLFFDIDWIRYAGGNITSGNGAGMFRSNGGMGGTVIDYANFLLAISWVLFFTNFKKGHIKVMLYAIFSLASYLIFSRSLFVALLLMFMIHVLAPKNLKNFLLMTIFTFLIILLLIFNFESVVDFYYKVSGHSDLKRIQSWYDLFVNISLIEIFTGVTLGGNTGLFSAGVNKISGDGFITGFTYDAGLVVLVMFLGIIIHRIYLIPCNLKIRFSIIFSFLLMLMINSGFEKLFVVMTYILAIFIVHSSHSYAKKNNTHLQD
jgi:hypothetical protein